MGLISYGEAVGLLSAFIWAVNSLIIRTQSFNVPPTLMNAIRCAVAALFFWCLLPFNANLSDYARVTPYEWACLMSSVTIGVVVGDTLYLWSIREIGVARTMALVGTTPITTLAFEKLLLGLEVSSTFVLGCFLAASGVFCLAGKPKQTHPDTTINLKRGVLLSLSAALLWGLSTTLLKPAIANLTAVQANSIRMPFVAGLTFLTWRLRSDGMGLQQLGKKALIIVAFTGLLGMGVGSLFYLTTIGLVGPSKTATLTAATPVFALIMSILFLKEKITLRLLLGVLLCASGVYMVL
ncbi:MAG: DMT family transporter [bacterium]|nr:DMT family transporter [bacterium]